MAERGIVKMARAGHMHSVPVEARSVASHLRPHIRVSTAFYLLASQPLPQSPQVSDAVLRSESGVIVQVPAPTGKLGKTCPLSLWLVIARLSARVAEIGREERRSPPFRSGV